MIAKSLDPKFELVSLQRLNDRSSSILVMNIYGDTVLKDRDTQSGPMVMIKGVETGSKFVRQLSSKNYIRATDMSASPDVLKKSAMLVGEWRGAMEMCVGGMTLSQAEPTSGRSVFYAEFPVQSATNCPSKSGAVSLTGETAFGCDMHSPKVKPISIPAAKREVAKEPLDAHLIVALTSGCNSNSDLLSSEVGVIAHLLATPPAAARADAPSDSPAKVLIRGDAVTVSLDAMAVRGTDVWIGGIVSPTSTTCTPTTSSKACFLKGDKLDSNLINARGVWVARLKIENGGVKVKSLSVNTQSLINTASSLLPFVFSRSDSDYNIHVMVRSAAKFHQTSVLNASAESDFPTSKWNNLDLGTHLSAPTADTVTSFTITELDDNLEVTTSPQSANVKVNTSYVLSVSEESGSNNEAGISNFYALYPTPPSTDAAPLLNSTLISYALQTSKEVVLTKLEPLGGPESGNKTVIPSSLLLSSQVSLLPNSKELFIASKVASIDDLKSYSIVTSVSPTTPPTTAPKPSPSPSPPPVLVELPAPPVTLPAPVNSTTEEEKPYTPSPLYVSPEQKPMSNTIKWSIFAIILVAIAIAAMVGYRFYHAKYVAPLAQRHAPLASSPSHMEVDP